MDAYKLELYFVLFFSALAGLVMIAEIVVRFTPTEKDDGAVKRIGDRLDKVLDLLKVPNRKKPQGD
jgi:hypothetical protein